MTQSPFGPYHLGEQRAAGLLDPVEAQLNALAARLTHFVQRIPMSESDRESVARVEAIVREARDRVARELQSGHTS